MLVRHGHSQATANRVVGGPKGCTGLTELGRRQVSALAERWRRTQEVAEATALYASTLPRAIETAELLAAGLPELEIVDDCDLCEIHPGECDGMPWTDYEARFGPTEYDRPLSPGGESYEALYARVDARLPRFVEDHPGETIVVATHGGFIIGSLLKLLKAPPMQGAWLSPDNSSITEWTHTEDRWTLVRYNDVAHLSVLL